MNFNAKDFVRSSFILFVTVTLCKATVHFEKKRLIEHKRVTTSPTTLQLISKIQCVAECIKEGRRGKCTFPGYNKASRTCYLGVDGTLGILDTTDAMSGVFFDESFACIEEGFLINGPNPLPKEYMTASTILNRMTSADSAILHNQFVEDITIGSWCPAGWDYDASTAYIQVRFHPMSLIKFLATQGRATRPDGCCNKWVESYTLEISKDCNTFNFLQDENGQIIVFPGNTDRDSVVNNTIPAQTTASCIRLHPSLVARDACLRMDVWGCQQTQYP